MGTAKDESSGLLGSVLATVAQILRNANEGVGLIRAELRAERDRLLRCIAITVMSVFLVAFGSLLGVAAVMLVMPESWRAATAGIAALTFWGFAVWGVLLLRQERTSSHKGG